MIQGNRDINISDDAAYPIAYIADTLVKSQ
jgi:hypothetical protein